MKRKVLPILLIMETLILIVMVVVGIILYNANYTKKELLSENSPDGNYTLIISRIGEPDWPFGSDHLKVTLFANDDDKYISSFQADVASDGGEGSYKVAWEELGARITLSGSEQPDAQYILPFKE